MLYKRLRLEELKTLEKQFIQFLAVNTITAKDWTKITSSQPDRAEKLIEEFSDVVLGSVIEKVKYLVSVEKNSILCFYFGEDKMIVYGLNTDEDASFNIANDLFSAIKNLSESAKIHTFSQVKNYSEKREIEIFNILETGARVADEYLFHQIQQLHLQTIST